jgi:hypothetical protein
LRDGLVESPDLEAALAAKDDFKPVKLQRPGPDHRVQSLPRRDNDRQCLSGFETTIMNGRPSNHQGIAGKMGKNLWMTMGGGGTFTAQTFRENHLVDVLRR